MDGEWRKNKAALVVFVLMSMLFTGAVYASETSIESDTGESGTPEVITSSASATTTSGLVIRRLPSKLNLGCSGGSGEIWAQHADGSCDDLFDLGEEVYLGGQGFDPNKEYSYKLLDVDDNDAVEASETGTTDGSGNINAGPIWTIPPDDYVGHNYTVEVEIGGKCKCSVVTKEDGFSTIPEFPTVAIPAIMTLGGYLAMRVRRRKV